MRLLLINPNTTAAITAKVATVARQVASPGVEIDAITGRFGARYIASRAAYAVAAHAAIDAYANHDAPHDAVVLACFGDPGLDALREISPKPVIGMAEASIHAACQMGARFAIVTGGVRWVAMLEEFVSARGLSARLAGVHAVAPTGGAIAVDPDAALAPLADACRAAQANGADVVILGGAGLAGLTEKLKPRVPVPLIDCIVATIVQAEAAISHKATNEGPAAGTSAVESIGLSAALARRLP